VIGKGHVTLLNVEKKKYTIKNVLYIVDSDEQILSLCKLLKANFTFKFIESNYDDDDFLLSAQSLQFELIGHATNNILSIFEFSNKLLEINTITRSASKRCLFTEVQ